MSAGLNFLYENIWVGTTDSILDAQVWEKEPRSASVRLRQDECPVCSTCIVMYKSIKVQINSTILKALRCLASNSIFDFAWPNVETKASLHRQRWKESMALLSLSPSLPVIHWRRKTSIPPLRKHLHSFPCLPQYSWEKTVSQKLRKKQKRTRTYFIWEDLLPHG